MFVEYIVQDYGASAYRLSPGCRVLVELRDYCNVGSLVLVKIGDALSVRKVVRCIDEKCFVEGYIDPVDVVGVVKEASFRI